MKIDPQQSIREVRQRFQDHPNVIIGERVFLESAESIGNVGENCSLKIGDESIFWEKSTINVCGRGKLSIGKRCTIGANNRIMCRDQVALGDYVMISWNFTLYDFESHPVNPELRKKQMDYMTAQFNPFCNMEDISLNDRDIAFFDSYWDNYDRFPHDPVIIGDNVWIGYGVSVFKGVTIGDNSVIAAHSVVTRDIPANCVAAGIPARPVKEI